MFENEENYMSYVESVSLRTHMEESVYEECEWKCNCPACIMKEEEFNKQRGVIVMKEDSDVVEDFIS